MTEKIKGIIEETGSETVTTAKGTATKFFVKLKNDQRKFSGWGSCPENWKEDGEVELEFDTKTTDAGATFFNITNKPRERYGGGLAEAIKLLIIPKITVGFEKTIQESQYEPRKAFASISVHAEDINPQKLHELMEMAKSEVMNQMEKMDNPAKAEPSNIGPDGKVIAEPKPKSKIDEAEENIRKKESEI